MKIIGIGTDLVEVTRIKDALNRFSERFVEKTFLPEEIHYAQQHVKPETIFAARFAAKEAVGKALGTGVGGEAIALTEIEVKRSSAGKPWVVLHGKGELLAQKMGIKEIHLTISHTDNYATATAVIVGE
jgi:holo-[acyl-carrier protein] synthase